MSDAFSRYDAAKELRLDELPPELLAEQIARLYSNVGPEVRRLTGFFMREIESGRLPTRVHVVTVEHWARTEIDQQSGERRYLTFESDRADTLPPAAKPTARAAPDWGRMFKTSTREIRLIAAADFAAWPDRPPPKPDAWVWAWMELAAAGPATAPAYVAPPDPAPPSPRRTRTDRLGEAIEAALADLRQWLGREPTDPELHERLRPGRDTTGAVVDENDLGLIWTDSQGKSQTTKPAALFKRFKRMRARDR